MKSLSRLVCAISALTLVGCANLNTQSRNFSGHQAEVKTVDASQRAIFSVHKKYGNDKQWTAVCAEPSPDALIAYATSVGASLNAPGKANLDLALSQSQAAASIGLRTQTIQLLRDGMYRLCEAYASGSIDNDDMESLQRRYQNMMIGLLAIEQITGPVVARQSAFSTAAGAAIGKALGDIVKELKEASDNLTEAKGLADEAVSGLKEANDKVTAVKNGTDGEKKAAADALEVAKSKKTEADKALESAKRIYGGIEELMKNAQKLAASASGSAVLMEPVAGGTKPTTGTDYSKAVDGVVDIVKAVLLNNHRNDICESLDSNSKISKTKNDKLNAVLEYCVAREIPITLASNESEGERKAEVAKVEKQRQARTAELKGKLNSRVVD